MTERQLYECKGCGDQVEQRDGEPELPCLVCGTGLWERVGDGDR